MILINNYISKLIVLSITQGQNRCRSRPFLPPVAATSLVLSLPSAQQSPLATRTHLAGLASVEPSTLASQLPFSNYLRSAVRAPPACFTPTPIPEPSSFLQDLFLH